jgi:protein SCO1/2
MVLSRAARAGLALAVLLAQAATAHDGSHPEPAAPSGPIGGAFPADIGGPFRLIDQHGRPRAETDPDGRAQLLFFGYATCPGICSSVLPQLAALTDRLEEAGLAVTPILVTVDPELDTVESLARAAPDIHPRLTALTGTPEALAGARAAFGVESKLLFVSPEHGPIHAHGSYIYLLDPRGRFLTLLPPILSTERMAEIVRAYVTGTP